MTRLCRLAASVLLIVLSTSLIRAQDLSRYRDFQFGTNLGTVAARAGMAPDEAKTLYRRPALIQELWWKRHFATPSRGIDPVREVVFSFCDGALFRMVVNYDRNRTEGLTDEEMIESISARYGIAVRPARVIVMFSSSQVYNDHESVIARWEDSEYSYNLYRSANQPTFGMLIFSKRLDALAQAAVTKAKRLRNLQEIR